MADKPDQHQKPAIPGRLNRLWQSITQVFKKPTDKTPVEASANEEEIRDSRWQKMRDSWHEFSDRLKFSEDDNNLLNSINAYIIFASNLFQKVGQQDGRIPSRNYAIRGLATSQATILTDQVCTKLEERIVASDEMISSLAAAQQRESAACDSWQKFKDEMNDFYQRHYQSFSMPTAVLTIAFGFILMIADIPLSLALVGNFDIGVEHETIWEKITDLELITFSLGIAFSTIYIKILYDEYISNRLGTFSSLSIISAQTPTVQTNIPKHISVLSVSNEFRIKLIIKLVILCALLAMLVYLGWFRNMYAPFAKAADYPDGEQPTFSPDWVVHVRLMSFILITVVVPVISGISLSTGFSILHNRRVREKCETKLQVLTQQLKVIENDLMLFRAKRQEFAVALSKWQLPTRIEVMAREFAGFYEQGFNQTFRELYGNDLFKQVTVVRNELIGALLSSKVKSSLNHTYEN